MTTLRSRLLRGLIPSLTVVLGAWSLFLFLGVRGLVLRNFEADRAYEDLMLRERTLFLRLTLRGAYDTSTWLDPKRVPDVSGTITRVTAPLNPHIGVRVLAGDGRVVAKSDNMPEVPFPSPGTEQVAKGWVHAVENLTNHRGETFLVATCGEAVPGGSGDVTVAYIQSTLPAIDTHASLRRLGAWLAAAFAMAMASTILAVRLATRGWRRMVTDFSQSAGKAGLTPVSRLTAPEGDADLVSLAEGINRLLDTFEAARVSQQRFVADAAHELCTPLALLRGEVELILRKPRSTEEYRAALRSSQEEIERLSRLAEQMLTLAASDSQGANPHETVFPLVEACHDAVDRLAPSAEARGVRLAVEATARPLVRGDRDAMVRVVWNLVENAIQHTPKDESVLVSIQEAGACVDLKVRDTGEGIPEAHLPRLFDRFYRVDKGRSRATGGAGLGLSIVKSIVEAHRGSIQVESRLGHGTTFTVRLPITGSPQAKGEENPRLS